MRGIVTGYADRSPRQTLLRRREGDRHHTAGVPVNGYRTPACLGQGRIVTRRTHLYFQRA